jgi:hypothetical protein
MIAEAGLVLDRRPLLGELLGADLVFRLAHSGVDFRRVFGHAGFGALGFCGSGFHALAHVTSGRAGGTRRAIGIERN